MDPIRGKAKRQARDYATIARSEKKINQPTGPGRPRYSSQADHTPARNSTTDDRCCDCHETNCHTPATCNATTLMPLPTLRPPQQRVLELGVTAKRRSQPAATSSPKNIAPPPMEVDIRPLPLGDLNSLHHKQIDGKNNDISKIFTFGKAWNYDSPEGIEATVLECRKADEKWEERKKNYVVRYGGLYRLFRQPGHSDHIPEWWNFLTTFQTATHLHQKRRATEVKDLLREAKDGYLYVVTPPPPEPPRK